MEWVVPMTYRNYHITYAPPPIPTRAHDWHYAHDGYDGPGDPRHGTAPTLEAARQAVDELCEEYGE